MCAARRTSGPPWTSLPGIAPVGLERRMRLERGRIDHRQVSGELVGVDHARDLLAVDRLDEVLNGDLRLRRRIERLRREPRAGLDPCDGLGGGAEANQLDVL